MNKKKKILRRYRAEDPWLHFKRRDAALGFSPPSNIADLDFFFIFIHVPGTPEQHMALKQQEAGRHV